jgi:hypothetical protein
MMKGVSKYQSKDKDKRTLQRDCAQEAEMPADVTSHQRSATPKIGDPDKKKGPRGQPNGRY